MKKTVLAGTVILGVFLAGCSNNSNALPSQGTNNQTASSTTAASSETAAGSQSTTVQSSTTGSSTASSNTTSTNSVVKVTAEQAIKAYQDAYPNTSVTSLDLDTSFGSYYYEIKGMDDSVEYEVKVDANTGAVTKEREERLDSDEQNGVERNNEKLDLDGIMTIDEAAAVAVKTVGQGEAIEWSLERELTTTYWEVKVQSGRSETSVKMDAKTGDILETELDD